MHVPGITVRPLRQMTGESHFNEVFLDGVRVPAANVIGEVNGGWRVARTMLAFERQALGGMGSSGGGRGGIGALVEEARARGVSDRPEVRQRLADLRARQMVLRHLAGHLAANRNSGGEAAILKLAMAQLVQDAADVAVQIAGASGVAWDSASRAVFPPAPERAIRVHRRRHERGRAQRHRRARARASARRRGGHRHPVPGDDGGDAA
jgi:alkylation response protein AidB-like acyl-CoA dehydrogenase